MLETEVKNKITLLENTDKLIVTLPDLPFNVPRGKYTAYIYSKLFKLHGKSYNYSIYYTNIKRVFMLPLPDGENIYLLMNFTKPLR